MAQKNALVRKRLKELQGSPSSLLQDGDAILAKVVVTPCLHAWVTGGVPSLRNLGLHWPRIQILKKYNKNRKIKSAAKPIINGKK